nr:immunoglobulin light chain junction region [Macaca mulatta]MOW34767.1 immunoglobulin light chain junction region [Macaca mulatta]MOW34799.1 immunoglobulin light chain junction region [Macaca mulatta]MOW35165.1 immunoglobulin light chain junction region [Macaca mulatta]MOW35326.1 immunoglobulin light chain junction region [Macaca mulatta]
CQHHISFPYSF